MADPARAELERYRSVCRGPARSRVLGRARFLICSACRKVLAVEPKRESRRLLTRARGRPPRRCCRRGRGRRRRSTSRGSGAAGPGAPLSVPPAASAASWNAVHGRPGRGSRIATCAVPGLPRVAIQKSGLPRSPKPDRLGRIVHELRVPERRERRLVEPLRCLDVADVDADVVDHGVHLSSGLEPTAPGSHGPLRCSGSRGRGSPSSARPRSTRRSTRGAGTPARGRAPRRPRPCRPRASAPRPGGCRPRRAPARPVSASRRARTAARRSGSPSPRSP